MRVNIMVQRTPTKKMTQHAQSKPKSIGIVIIGRNEGERLTRCLAAIDIQQHHVVYVDSASSDNSVMKAQNASAHVIELDMSIPFTAARARNVGWQYLYKQYPELKYIQFVDGDCELKIGWLEEAITFLDINEKAAVVCGSLVEKFPQASIYNYMCNEEWKRKAGEVYGCGGIALMRLNALIKVNGYNAQLIASEESEMCIRMRQIGFVIYKIDVDMALHNAAILKFSQWWKRCVRSGFASPLLAEYQLKVGEKSALKGSIRPFFWVLLPLFILLLTFYSPFALILFVYIPWQVLRVFLMNKDRSLAGLQSSFFNLLSKFPESIGVIKYLYSRLKNKSSAIIEYK